jgi:hypothetical protein
MAGFIKTSIVFVLPNYSLSFLIIIGLLFSLAAIVGPGLFTLGAAAGHIYQMLTEHNFAPGNAGIIFYMDIIIPLFGLLLLWFQRRDGRVAA